MSLRFGEFELDRERRQLLRSGEPVPLEPRAYELLVLLVERRPKALSRAQIRDVVWPGTFISESTLGVTVNAIRQALEDDARKPRFIRTVHSFGYAFSAEVAGDEEREKARPPELRSPYPGLSSFTEADAGVFFGREAEVEALWERLRRRRLLALIGPSGAGKTSFLRAGVIPARPEGWGAIVSTPGRSPMTGLGQALASEVAGDAKAVRELLRFDDPDVALGLLGRWRHGVHEALLVVDQFEELFTLNPPPTQARFAQLLGRLSAEAGIHVLLSLRDDFLIRCHEHEALGSVFTADLTPLLALQGEGLRRALMEPAKKEGFSFEDDAFMEEMVEAVESERGALPLLAFAVGRLWEKRDRERRLLTWKAYEEIGGVAGALAQHAEHTLERIGPEREPIVRELFRNLMTAQQTRAAAEREELLGVLPDREAGAQVLDQLIDARLLTSYEVRQTDRHPERAAGRDRAKDLSDGQSEESPTPGSSRRRIEIVHESLLRAWPRLVRWQAQDEEGLLLRDQLKQAAHLWEEKGRPDDLLWTGTSEREFELWRERYPGALTALEGDFAKAMVDRTRRRNRLRRIATAAVVIGLSVVAGVIAVSRQQAVRSAERADREARRSEAATLLSLARDRLAEHPTEALAYATASLERADHPAVRYVALEALWRGPTEFRFPFPTPYPQFVEFSPDGRWLAAESAEGGGALFPSDGGPPTPLQGSEETLLWRFSPKGDLLAGCMDQAGQTLGLWSVPEGRLLSTFRLTDKGQVAILRISDDSQTLSACAIWPGDEGGTIECHTWNVRSREHVVVARIEVPNESLSAFPDADPGLSRLAWADGQQVRIAPLEAGRLNTAKARTIRHEGTVALVIFDEQGRRLATSWNQGLFIGVWSLERDPPELLRTLRAGQRGGRVYESGVALRFHPSAPVLAGYGGVLWDLTSAPDAEPLQVQGCNWELAFTPDGRWLTTGCGFVSFWPLARSYPQVLEGHTGTVTDVAFTPDGRRLVSGSLDGSVRVWPLEPGATNRSQAIFPPAGALREPRALRIAPDESFAVFGDNQGRVHVLPLDGGPPRELSGITDMVLAVAVGPDSRRVAAGAGFLYPSDAVVRVWDLVTGEVQVLDAGDSVPINFLKFTGEGDVLAATDKTLRRWDLTGTVPRVVDEVDVSGHEGGDDLGIRDFTPDARELLLSAGDRLWIEEVETHGKRDVIWNGRNATWASFDPTGNLVVSGDAQGAVRVGSARGGEPHLLLGHEDAVQFVSVSPDGQRVAAGGVDGSIRIWPMPDLSKPPLHTLPRDELIAKLKSLTNLRAVRDPESATGWKIEAGPFPGWETVPTW